MTPLFYARQLYPRDREKQEVAKLAFKAGLAECEQIIEELKKQLKNKK